MTTPQQPPTSQQDTELALAAATVLMTAITPAAALSLLVARFRLSRIVAPALLTVLEIVMSMPPEVTGAAGPATLAAIRTNALRRGQFAVAAGRRVTLDIADARSRGQSIPGALAAAASRERRYFGQHLDAMWQRATAAMSVDQASWTYGDLLGWYTVRDAKTSPDCLAADGRNFLAAVPPAIGYPGAVHPHCRCYPGPAHIGARMLPATYQPARVLVRSR